MSDDLQGDLDSMLLAEPASVELSLREGSNIEATLEVWVGQCRDRTMQDPERGVVAGERLVQLCETFASARTKARAYSAMCHALSYAGRMKQAIEVSSRAIAAAEESGDEWVLGEACLTAVQSHNVIGLRDEAFRLASRAGEVFGRAGDIDRAATATMLTGVVLRMLDRPAEALERFDRAPVGLGPNTSLRAQLASNRAEALLDLGRFDDARASFESAAEGFRSIGESFGVAIVEGNLADLASRRGRLREALVLFLSAGRAFRTVNDEPEAARLDAEAAELFLAIGDHREAISRLPAAIEALRTAGMQTELNRAMTAFGVALGRAGEVERSLEVLDAAERESLVHGQALAAARAVALRGSVLLSHGRAAEAAETLQAALDRDPLEPARARLLVDLCRSHLALDDPLLAASSLAQADELAARLGLADLDVELHSVRAAIHRQKGEFRRATESLEQALEGIESVRGLFGGDRLRAAALGSRSLAFDEGIRLALATDDPVLALRVAEAASARSLGDRLAGDGGMGSTDEVVGIEGDISATLSMIEEARFAGRSDARTAELPARLRSQQQSLASAELRGEAYARQPTKGSRAEWNDILASLPENAAAVVVIPAGDELARLTLRRDYITLEKLSLTVGQAQTALEHLLTDIDRALVRLTMGRTPSTELDAGIRGRLRLFGEQLIGGPSCGIDRMVVVLPRELSRLPLSALIVGDGYLVERCAVTVAPSLGWAQRAARVSGRVRAGLVIAGVADELAPQIDAEVDRIAEGVAGAIVLRGPEATLARISQIAARSRVIHIACHAEYVPEDPMGSRLRLGEGWVSARRIAELDLHGATVVLGGCETGAVDSAYAGEQFGLIRAALLAGATGVIASRWRLSDVAAAELFATLHSDRDGVGNDPICGLSRVLARAASGNVHPALWGGLFAIGSWT